MRNAHTRPVSWKICESEQMKKAIDAGGFLCESLFIRMLTSRDNVGRMMANKDFLRGFLYPKMETINAEDVEAARDRLAEFGLIIVYKVNGVEYLAFPKIGEYSKITGNMSNDTQIPDPPREVVWAWEDKFKDVYTPLERRTNGVHTSYERCTNGVHTGSEEPPKVDVRTEGEREREDKGEVEGEREREGERKESHPAVLPKARTLTPVQRFVEGFEKTYTAFAGHQYKHSNKDFITATKLIKDFGIDEVVEKAKILAVLCHRGGTWFAKDGFSDFTIGNLSAHWNKILPQKKLTPDEIKKQEFLKNLKEEEAARERIGR